MAWSVLNSPTTLHNHTVTDSLHHMYDYDYYYHDDVPQVTSLALQAVQTHHNNENWELRVPVEWEATIQDKLNDETQSLPFYKLTTIDASWIGQFLNGHCWALAFEFNRILNWPVVEIRDSDNVPFHVMVRTPDNRLLDAEGLWYESDITSTWDERPYYKDLNGDVLFTLEQHAIDWHGEYDDVPAPRFVEYDQYEDSGWPTITPKSYTWAEARLLKTPEMAVRVLDVLCLNDDYKDKIYDAIEDLY